MDRAKEAVSNFTSKHGHHDTTVEEAVAAPVTQERVKPTLHEETQEAVDREVHQDHYHTTVQPVQHQEVLPEQHRHQMQPVVEKQFEHEDRDTTRARLEQEAGQFRDSSTTHETRHTTGAAARVEGEHTHHHVHETVQPIINKETIAPEVVHTTVPIHETHHAGTQHHGISALPTKTLEEVTGSGLLDGRSGTKHEEYDGKPRAYNKDLKTTAEEVMHPHHGHHHNTGATEQRGL